jgi:prefoldin subunit 5
MKDPNEVLRRKEAELEQLQEEVEALRMVGRMLAGDKSALENADKTGKILRMPNGPINLA